MNLVHELKWKKSQDIIFLNQNNLIWFISSCHKRVTENSNLLLYYILGWDVVEARTLNDL